MTTTRSPSSVPKGTLAERLLRQKREYDRIYRQLHRVPKGTLAERLLRRFLGARASRRTAQPVPKGTLAERLLRLPAVLVLNQGRKPLGPERDLGRKAIETRTHGGLWVAAALFVPKGTLAERLLRLTHTRPPCAGCLISFRVPKGTLAERLLRPVFGTGPHENAVFAVSRKGPWPKGY